jgi:hypothetical protein
MKKIRISSGLVFTFVSLTGLALSQLGHAEEIPRPELGCQVLDAKSDPINPADQTSQQRVEVIRCMNAADRERDWQSRLQKSQEQTAEIVRNARQTETGLSVMGLGRARNPYLPPTGRPRAIP